jgi:protein-L-isoaspartate(D-aspartate) O-methyltransferase
MKVKQVQPSHTDSYEHFFHQVNSENFLLPLRNPLHQSIHKKLLTERLERAIGVIYRPENELQSHYFYASMPGQFDEYSWFDETHAVDVIERDTVRGAPDTFPIGS